MTPHPSINDIINEVARQHGVEVVEIIGDRRTVRVVKARDEAAYRLRIERRMSYPEIASALGFRSHTSVLVAIKRHETRK